MWGELVIQYPNRFKTSIDPEMSKKKFDGYLHQMAYYSPEIIQEALYRWIYVDANEYPPSPIDLARACKEINQRKKPVWKPELSEYTEWPLDVPKPSKEEVEEFKKSFGCNRKKTN